MHMIQRLGIERTYPQIPIMLCPIILALLDTMERLRDELTVSNTIASQFVDHDLPGLAAM